MVNGSPLDGTGSPRALWRTVWWRLRHLVALRALGIFLLLTGSGLLVAHVLDGVLAGEEGINKYLEARRTPDWDLITQYASRIGNTEIIIMATLVVAIVLRLWLGRWREAVFLMVAVTLAASIFTLTTFPVERPRPDVAKLDPAPPTSSFPSGHVGAATALYGGLALLLWRAVWPAKVRSSRLVWLVLLPVLVAVPLAVAAARMYRGMHFLSDVSVGIVNGLLCVALAAHAYLWMRNDPDASGVPRKRSAADSHR